MIVTRSETYFASWKINKYTVTFYEGDGDDTVFATLQVEHGSKVKSLPSIERKGYEFLGWFAANSDTKISNDTIITNNLDCHAHWTAIKYPIQWVNGRLLSEDESEWSDVDFGEENLPPRFSEYSMDCLPYDPEIKVSRPTMQGYDFVRWDVQKPGIDTQAKILVDDPLGTVTFTAVWRDKWFDVFFNPDNGGQQFFWRRVKYNQTIGELPENPTKAGYEFSGWQVGSTPVDEDTPITSAYETASGKVILQAKWTAIVCRVEFELAGGTIDGNSTYASVSVIWGSVLGDMLKTPDRTGYTFNDWWTLPNGGTKIEEDTPIKSDMKLYANWTYTNSSNLVYDGNGGSFDRVTMTYMGNPNSTITVDSSQFPTPTRAGYVFGGWHRD